MNSSYLRFVLWAVLFVVLQVWVLSPVALFRVATPYIYPFLLMLLPLGINRSVLYVIAFAIGGCIDLFTLTPGLHAAALTATAALRQPLLQLMTDQNTPRGELPLYSTLRSGSIVLMTLLLLAQHVCLYLLETGLGLGALHALISLAAGYALSWILMLLLLLFFGTRERSQGK